MKNLQSTIIDFSEKKIAAEVRAWHFRLKLFFEGLDEQQLKHVVAYVKLLSEFPEAAGFPESKPKTKTRGRKRRKCDVLSFSCSRRK